MNKTEKILKAVITAALVGGGLLLLLNDTDAGQASTASTPGMVEEMLYKIFGVALIGYAVRLRRVWADTPGGAKE